MKIEVISESKGYAFEEKINKFMSSDDISIIDIKYSTTCVKQEQTFGNTVRDVDVVIHNALIMYEDRKEI